MSAIAERPFHVFVVCVGRLLPARNRRRPTGWATIMEAKEKVVWYGSTNYSALFIPKQDARRLISIVHSDRFPSSVRTQRKCQWRWKRGRATSNECPQSARTQCRSGRVYLWGFYANLINYSVKKLIGNQKSQKRRGVLFILKSNCIFSLFWSAWKCWQWCLKSKSIIEEF